MFHLYVCLSFVLSLLSQCFCSHGQLGFPFKDFVEMLPVSNGRTTFWSRSDTDPKRLETTVPRSTSAQVPLMLVRLATVFVRPVPSEPSFNKVGTLLAAVCCCFMLRNVEVN